VLISGLTGSGKTVALKLLNDMGFTCVDNIPPSLLPQLVAQSAASKISKLDISLDIRLPYPQDYIQDCLRAIRRQGHPLRLLFLDSDTATLVSLYNAVHTFVLPSLSENLPNTIMEAMACGVPCVGFHVGGIPEEIDHKKNGYVARYRDAADLAQGIRWVLCEADYAELSAQAVRKVLANYSQQAVALQYIEVYNQALAFKKCML